LHVSGVNSFPNHQSVFLISFPVLYRIPAEHQIQILRPLAAARRTPPAATLLPLLLLLLLLLLFKPQIGQRMESQ